MNSAKNNRTKPTRSKFDETEDRLLTMIVSQMGTDNWKAIAEKMGGRTARQCRDRWKHYISPSTNTTEWSEDENRRLLQAFNVIGRHWGMLATMFPGRTSIGVRNHVWKLLRPHQTPEMIEKCEISADSSTESGSEAPDETAMQAQESQPKLSLPPITSLPFPPLQSFRFTPQIPCIL